MGHKTVDEEKQIMTSTIQDEIHMNVKIMWNSEKMTFAQIQLVSVICQIFSEINSNFNLCIILTDRLRGLEFV